MIALQCSTIPGTRAGTRAASAYKSQRAADCVFNALEGSTTRHWAIAVINSNAYFRSCIFRSLSENQQPELPHIEWERLHGALDVGGLNATLALENCTLTDIVNPLPLVASLGSLVYSDNPTHVVR